MRTELAIQNICDASNNCIRQITTRVLDSLPFQTWFHTCENYLKNIIWHISTLNISSYLYISIVVLEHTIKTIRNHFWTFIMWATTASSFFYLLFMIEQSILWKAGMTIKLASSLFRCYDAISCQCHKLFGSLGLFPQTNNLNRTINTLKFLKTKETLAHLFLQARQVARSRNSTSKLTAECFIIRSWSILHSILKTRNSSPTNTHT